MSETNHSSAVTGRRRRRSGRAVVQPPTRPPYDQPLQWPSLPVTERRDDIARVIQQHQVVIVAGETGSGKTTQLPKICLMLGRGSCGLIGHTQPRRLAARAVASRVAEELGEPLGQTVGCQVRFQYEAGADTRIKLMTDGILLAEIQRDRLLRRYDTLIIDEAHERSLNIDFLIGYLKKILPQRPDLKVIITSATIDVERFSAHFDGAPIVVVEGRSYPVTIDYLPEDALPSPPQELGEHVVAGLNQLFERERGLSVIGGDVLVFLSGERDIVEVEKTLNRQRQYYPLWQQAEIVPLYGRLNLKEQQRIFAPHKGRRIVLTTNVAETSLTVPGIRYVIDAGTARISRYNPRNRIQRLPIEAISQASANQRAGRCGRLEAGYCLRLYSAEDFASRPAFTDPEILRTNLAAVILQMLLLKLGELGSFPFLDMPDGRQISEGFGLLLELKAVDDNRQLTELGRTLAKLPVDPRVAAMLVAARDRRCLEEVMIIAAALSIQEPRERPQAHKQAADEKHKLFVDQRSDFLSYLHLWAHYQQQKTNSSVSALRRWCEQHFVSFLRMREWQDVYQQLLQSAQQAAWPDSCCVPVAENPSTRWRELSQTDYQQIHQALLVGLLSNVARKEEGREYLACRQRKLSIFPGSEQARRPPKWLMAAQLLETSQLFALCVAAVEPLWIVEAAAHLVKREHFEPYWDVERGQALIHQRVSLSGLVLLERQKVFLAAIDPALARELLIREALVAGHYRGRSQFHGKNQQLIRRVQDMEARIRRRDLLVDDDALAAFYHSRLPQTITTVRELDNWYRHELHQTPDILLLTEADILLRDVAVETLAQFPASWQFNGNSYRLDYRFEPGNSGDGVSLGLPLAMLNQIPAARLSWLVPGLMADKIQALLRNLPKQLRKTLVPLPQTAERLSGLIGDMISAEWVDCNKQTLMEVLSAQLQRHYQLSVPVGELDENRLDAFYRMNIQVLGDRRKVLKQGRDLLVLRAEFSEQARQVVAEVKVASSLTGTVLKQFELTALPETLLEKRRQMTVVAWPALVDKADSAQVELFDTEQQAQQQHLNGLTRLAVLQLPQVVKSLQKDLLRDNKVRLALAAFGSQSEVMQQLIDSAFRYALFDGVAALPRGKEDFETLLQARKSQIYAAAVALEKVLVQAVLQAQRIQQFLSNLKALEAQPTVADIRAQLDSLWFQGFLARVPYTHLLQYQRYMQAAEKRLEKLRGNVARDQQLIRQMAPYWQPLLAWWQAGAPGNESQQARWQLRWMLEEWRIALFAQPMKPLGSVSEKRVKECYAECGFGNRP